MHHYLQEESVLNSPQHFVSIIIIITIIIMIMVIIIIIITIIIIIDDKLLQAVYDTFFLISTNTVYTLAALLTSQQVKGRSPSRTRKRGSFSILADLLSLPRVWEMLA